MDSFQADLDDFESNETVEISSFPKISGKPIGVKSSSFTDRIVNNAGSSFRGPREIPFRMSAVAGYAALARRESGEAPLPQRSSLNCQFV